MSATIINIIIQLIAGALGGHGAGAALKDYDLGKLGNTIAGALGGVGGGQILTALLPMLAGTAGNVDIGSVIGQAVGGGVAGASSRNSSRMPSTGAVIGSWPPAQSSADGVARPASSPVDCADGTPTVGGFPAAALVIPANTSCALAAGCEAPTTLRIAFSLTPNRCAIARLLIPWLFSIEQSQIGELPIEAAIARVAVQAHRHRLTLIFRPNMAARTGRRHQEPMTHRKIAVRHHRDPAGFGRLLGLDRAPEVKTLRRRLTRLAAQSSPS
jgi:hypothetical protein